MLEVMWKLSLFWTLWGISSASWDVPNYMKKPVIYDEDVYRSPRSLSTNEDELRENFYRLPDSIIPLSYDLKIVPELDDNNFTFVGEVTIRISIANSTDEIVLNSDRLNFDISQVSITLNEAPIGQQYVVRVDNITHHAKYQRVSIKTAKSLKQDVVYALKIQYGGVLTTRMLGFYRSWYLLGDQIRWLASTQFESTFARSAFPCFDEPRFRSKFKLQIARDSNRSTISNMPLQSTSQPDASIGNRVWDVYGESPAMATYLFAFSVFDFARLTDKATGRVNVYAQNISIGEGEYIVNKAPTILDILGNYTNLTYPLPKIDIVAVPDFNAGAMENWGMTTYREKYVLYKENVSTTLDKQWILAVVAHEFTHQWFGDLVTPYWWDYTWLNEGFATYFEYYVPSVMEPELRMMDQFVIQELQPALSSDEGGNHPINANVSTPSQIDAVFDVISYNKAGSVIRMMKHFLGEFYYQKGLRHYLRHSLIHDSGTVTPNTLWHGLETKLPSSLLPNGTSLRTVVSTWVDQDGFPLLTLTRQNGTISVQQSQFTRSHDPEVGDGKSWWIPITFTTDMDVNFTDTATKLWLGPNQTIEMKLKDSGLQWIIFNIQQVGYYRVNYDTETWNNLAIALAKNHSIIHPLNRAHLLDDAFTLASCGKVDYQIPLNLSNYLEKEDDFIPWYVAIKHYRSLIWRFRGQKVGGHLEDSYKKFVGALYKKLASVNEQKRSYSQRLATSSIFPQACSLKIQECETEQKRAFHQWLQSVGNTSASNYTFDPDTKYTTLCTGIKLSNNTVWEAVWDYYVKTNVSTEKSLLLQVLGCSENSTSLKQYMSKLTGKQPDDIRTQDYYLVQRSLLGNPNGVQAVLEYLMENYSNLLNLLKPKAVYGFFHALGGVLQSDESYAQLSKFHGTIQGNYSEELKAVVNSTLNQIKRNQDWMKAYTPSLLQFYDPQANTTSSSVAPATSTSLQPGSSSTSKPATATTPSPTSASTAKPSSSSSINNPSLLFILLVTFLIFKSQ